MDQVLLTLKPHVTLTLKPSTHCMLSGNELIIVADNNSQWAANSCMCYHCFINDVQHMGRGEIRLAGNPASIGLDKTGNMWVVRGEVWHWDAEKWFMHWYVLFVIRIVMTLLYESELININLVCSFESQNELVSLPDGANLCKAEWQQAQQRYNRMILCIL